MTVLISRSEFILGGQRSGKSRRAESLARQWLDADPAHRAVMIATAQPWDAEMGERIARHQQDRTERLPCMLTVEEPLSLGAAIAQHSRADTLVVVDCLTLWLTNLLMPIEPVADQANSAAQTGQACTGVAQTAMDTQTAATAFAAQQEGRFLGVLSSSPGPLVLVGNEIGLGVIPMGAQVRAFVDALGRLNQEVAQRCQRVTLMAAGLPLTLKDALKDTST